jgi:preprotein translocase subunit SecA
MVLDLVKANERIIADLMDVSDAVRREAMQTLTDQAGRKTDDGVRIARSVKVGRNDACPCGSGKKWKKCCGRLAPVH